MLQGYCLNLKRAGVLSCCLVFVLPSNQSFIALKTTVYLQRLFARSTVTPEQVKYLPFAFSLKVNLSLQSDPKHVMMQTLSALVFASQQLKEKTHVQVLPNDVSQNPQLDQPAHHSHPPVPHQHLAGGLVLEEEVGEGTGDLVLHLLSPADPQGTGSLSLHPTCI